MTGTTKRRAGARDLFLSPLAGAVRSRRKEASVPKTKTKNTASTKGKGKIKTKAC